MVDFDKSKLIGLCNRIRANLIEKGKSHYLVKIASTNKDFEDVDDDVRDKLSDVYYSDGLDCDTRLVSYDCGGYSRTLQLDGVVVENDSLYLYLTEVEMSSNGDEDIDTYKEDLDGLLDERCWWMAGGNAEVEFCPDEVLEFYANEISDDDCVFIV